MFPFKSILDYITDEQCALVLGPEIMRFDDKPMHLFLRDKLSEQFRDKLTHYYASDGLFAFPAQDEWVKTDLAKAFKNECLGLPKLAGFDESLLKNIARLPFHLVISTNPDIFLSDVFYKYGVRHRFAHFRKGGQASDEVAVPSRDEPLIYNLSGSILEDESLVLDYEDLYSLLGSSFSGTGMPQGLQTALGKVRRFVFLGFDFEKWHTQLLLRILCGKSFQKKFAGPHRVSPVTRVFLANQFNVEFWDETKGDFLSTFLREAENYVPADSAKAAAPRLRPLAEDPLAPQEINILREIRNGQLTKAATMLGDFSKNTEKESEVVLIMGQLARLTADQSRIDSRDFQTAMNAIADTILKLARQIAQIFQTKTT